MKNRHNNKQKGKLYPPIQRLFSQSRLPILTAFPKVDFSQDLTFFFNSQDQRIKQTLLQRGWKQVLNPKLEVSLRWIYADLPKHYMQPGLINHFKNNKQLTSKQELVKNMRQAPYELQTYSFFPTSYLIFNKNQLKEFKQEFTFNQMIILLRKHFQFFKLKQPEFIAQFDICWSIKTKPNIPNRVRSILGFMAKKQDSSFLVNMNLLHELVKYFRFKISTLFIKQKKYCQHHYLQFNQAQFSKIAGSLAQWEKGLFQPFDSQLPGFTPHFYCTPSKYLIYKIYKYAKRISLYQPNRWKNVQKNLWIIKPCQHSKGCGIHLTKSYQQAQASVQNMSARLVQKYIQNPLILSFQEGEQQAYNGRKFDIRQWVLVTSFLPLKAFFFNKCYLRFCSQPFDISDYRNINKHATNYSLNKKYFTDSDLSVMSSDSFQRYIGSFKWKKIQKQMKEIVVSTLQACRNNVIQLDKCFQLYGFDILIDQKLKCHLLQVNLSPACEERTSFLTQYLTDMAQGLLSIVLDKTQFSFKKNRWERIVFEEQVANIGRDFKSLQIKGSKIQFRRERRQLNQRQRARWQIAQLIRYMRLKAQFSF